MPELPDIVVYIEALEQRILDQTLERVDISAPFLLRTAVPPITIVEGRKVVELRRLGKRICIGLEENLWLVLHLMIAGRLHWHERVVGAGLVPARVDRAATRAAPTERAIKQSKRGLAGVVESERPVRVVDSDRSGIMSVPPAVAGGSQFKVSRSKASPKISTPPKNRLATFDFSNGTLSLTEAGTQRRASLHLVQGDDGLKRFDPGGLEVFEIDLNRFAKVLQSANHTLKRALTDPRLFSGIGNAYSDEILFQARLSPIALTQKLTLEEIERLFESTRTTLTKWIELLRSEQIRTGSDSDRVGLRRKNKEITSSQPAIAFPEKVTAFRSEMAVHGKYQQPCPRCGQKIQRIRYASNETNYCPGCQTNGKLLADRALSRLLRADWPRTAEELEGIVRDK